jgi:hypothetical protein
VGLFRGRVCSPTTEFRTREFLAHAHTTSYPCKERNEMVPLLHLMLLMALTGFQVYNFGVSIKIDSEEEQSSITQTHRRIHEATFPKF